MSAMEIDFNPEGKPDGYGPEWVADTLDALADNETNPILTEALELGAFWLRSADVKDSIAVTTGKLTRDIERTS